MKIIETMNDGLKRQFAVSVAAADLAKKLEAEVGRVAPQMRLPGFRPGKVPAKLIKTMHGAALEGQILESSIQDATQKIFSDHQIRPALQPKIEVKQYGKDQDLEFSLDVEILPDIPTIVLQDIKLEKLVAPVNESDLDAAVRHIAEAQKNWVSAPEGHQAALGDAVIIDFAGKIDGVPFDAGTGEGMQVVLGSGQLIPGFEDQMVGMVAQEARVINVTFPDDYHAKELAGRDAVFDISAQDVKIAAPVEIDDMFAQNLGLESLEQLRNLVKDRVMQDHDSLSRTHLKRKLFDALAAQYSFEVPTGMVDAEFAQIWKQLENETGGDAEAQAKIEAEKESYRTIAERRVRLGLILAHLGQENNIDVSQTEVNRLIAQEASKYPGQQKQVVQFFQNTPSAVAQLRAPLYEEKVVDFIFSNLSLTERTVPLEDIRAAIEEEEISAPASVDVSQAE